jgi:hypothetical protein
MDRVPVLLDAFSDEGEISLVRCLYFHIEVDETLGLWTLGAGIAQIPFFMVGLAGILLAPSVTEPRFVSVPQLSNLFSAIEARDGQSVETGDIWFPQRFLPYRNQIHRGAVLRIEPKVFLTAMQVRAGGRDFTEAFENVTSEGAMENSPEETRVFAEWSKIQISEFGRWQNVEYPPRRHGTGDNDILDSL